jgi:hypothetical protein
LFFFFVLFGGGGGGGGGCLLAGRRFISFVAIVACWCWVFVVASCWCEDQLPCWRSSFMPGINSETVSLKIEGSLLLVVSVYEIDFKTIGSKEAYIACWRKLMLHGHLCVSCWFIYQLYLWCILWIYFKISLGFNFCCLFFIFFLNC